MSDLTPCEFAAEFCTAVAFASRTAAAAAALAADGVEADLGSGVAAVAAARDAAVAFVRAIVTFGLSGEHTGSASECDDAAMSIDALSIAASGATIG